MTDRGHVGVRGFFLTTACRMRLAVSRTCAALTLGSILEAFGMAGKGFPPTPAQTAADLGKRGAGPANGTAPGGRPECPDWLPELARDMWEQVLPALEQMGVLATCDLGVVAAYCVAWHDLQTATAAIEDEGMTVPAGSGGLKAHPALALQASAIASLRLLGDSLGLTPTGRNRLRIKQPGDPNPKPDTGPGPRKR